MNPPSTSSSTGSTRAFLYEWLLKILAMVTPVFFLHECVIFALNQSEADAEQTRIFLLYLASALALAIGNFTAWKLLRGKTTQTTAFLQLLFNTLAFALFVGLGMVLYGARVAPVLLPVFVLDALIAAILCDLSLALLMGVVCSVLHAGLILFGQRQGLVDQGVLDFLPASSLFVPAFVLPVSFVTRAMVQGEEKLRVALAAADVAHARLVRAQEGLKKHVAPQLARLLFEEGGELLLEHRRRKVTLFFSDVKDFTISVDAIEPEELGRLLNNYLEEMVQLAIAHSGTVAQISGDGLFVIFGAPDFESDEKHAKDAVAMAVAMQRRMVELRETWFTSGIEHPFQIRCGVNTGMATVGAFGAEGRREYSAVGLQTNIAARLEGACTPGKVLISHATWALVHKTFTCVDLGDRELKGVGRPMKVYEIDPQVDHPSSKTSRQVTEVL
ncbi:MAG: adenylate/guanylate cyclase domain-containing protein [Deltaproteobacteria bacterium]|nr:adenylate/guanylate cyclase domain-containing protein [Deltaproteobacteria bacterium]